MSLTIVGTPIGNIGDATQNLIAAIKNSEIILAEDSRRFQRLCKDLAIEYDAKIISFFEGNESARIVEVEKLLLDGKKVLLLTDAGMPGVSDPGYRAVRVAIENNIALKVVPGPSAVTTALVLSGLPCDRFSFDGFLPRTAKARIDLFNELANETRTMIFFESPHRLQASIDDAAKVFGGQRLGAICREMTKTYEEVVRGDLAALQSWCASKEILGEITLVIAGFAKTGKWCDIDLMAHIERCEAAGYTRKEAISDATTASGWSKREIFDLLVANKKEK